MRHGVSTQTSAFLGARHCRVKSARKARGLTGSIGRSKTNSVVHGILIRSRLKVYLPFIESLKKIDQKPNAVDLGCGRGEWLELLRDSGFEAQGVDLDESMLAACREIGLQVKKGDAIAFLRELPDASQTIVSGFHIAEHLAFFDLRTLVEEALRVLKPAGLLILETPNPENLRVGATNFYTDPTHKNPLPPHLLAFLPEYYGYTRIKVLRLQESPELAKSSNASLGDVLAGVSPDYAVVAQKASDRTTMAATAGAFEAEHGLTLDMLVNRFDQQLVRQANESTHVAQEFAKATAIAEGFAKAASSWEQISSGFFAELSSKNAIIAQRDKKISEVVKEIALLNLDTAHLRQAINERDEQIRHLQKEMSCVDKETASLRQVVDERNEQVRHLQTEMSRVDKETASLRQVVDERNEQVRHLQTEMSRADTEAARLHHVIQECNAAFEIERSRLGAELAASNDALSVRAAELALLNQREAALREHLAAIGYSKSWRITAPLRFVGRTVRWLVPGLWAWIRLRPGTRPRRMARRTIVVLSKQRWVAVTGKILLVPIPSIHARLKSIVRSQPTSTQTIRQPPAALIVDQTTHAELMSLPAEQPDLSGETDSVQRIYRRLAWARKLT